MNLIVSRPLGQAERQLINELTLKKRQSKKSTMSEKQRRARQQLAKELEHERKSPSTLNNSTFTCYSTNSTTGHDQSIDAGINTINLSSVSVSQASSSDYSSGGGDFGGVCGKLEYLNEELKRRLYEYEYLVAQEKALLGAYNLMLFTNEGVSNFHPHC